MSIKKYVVLISLGLSFISPIAFGQPQKKGLREKIVLELFEKSLADHNYTQAYYHVKYMERYPERDHAFWAYNKLKCLIHIANFNETQSPFVSELRTTITYLQDINGSKGVNQVNNQNNKVPAHLQPKSKQEELDLDIDALALQKKKNSEVEEEEDMDEDNEEQQDDEELEEPDENIADNKNPAGGKIKLSGNVPTLLADNAATDMYWVHTIQMNYLQEGERLNNWKKDPDYAKGIQLFEKQKYEKAYENLLLATSRSNGLAYITLGQMAEKGLGIPKDLGAAAAYFEQAAELHIGPAYLTLAEYLRVDGNQRMKLTELSQDELKDYYNYLQQAADLNVTKAKYLLAQYYLDAPSKEDPKTNAIKAYNWMAQAAGAGSIEAQYMMAVMHCKGTGTIKSHDEAQYWINLLTESQIISSEKIVELQDCIKDL